MDTHSTGKEKEKDATPASDDAELPAQSKGYKGWLKDFDYKKYIGLKRGKERKAYLMSFGHKHGLQLPVTTTTTTLITPCVKQANSPKHACESIGWPKGLSRTEYFSKKQGKERRDFMANYKRNKMTNTKSKLKTVVPQQFAWPEGMNRQDFFAKQPGKERMTYLARYIKKNNIELEKTASQVKLPIGRQPEQRAHPRCRCFSSEACASCSRCMEVHCGCGLTGHQRRAVCQESRACSCSLMDPLARCDLCHGCRQPHGFSHCRCVLHQRLLWQKRHPKLGNKLTEEEKDKVCSCFLLAHRHGGADATSKNKEIALNEIERVRRIKRATGFTSSDNIYRNKKVIASLGGGRLESDYDDKVDDGPGSEVFLPSTESVIPRTMTRRLLDPEYNPASYHPLFRSEGCSLLESIEPRGGRISRKGNAAFNSNAIQGEICRGLENMAFEIDRNNTMPPDDLVEFLVYMASIKSANIGELIGTFDDTAAIAASIVIEEYMAQLIEDTAVQQRALCPVTEASVQEFTRELLVGFNWLLFEQQHPFTPSGAMDRFTSIIEKEAALRDTLSTLLQQEFLSTQPNRFDMPTRDEDLFKWIQSAIIIPSFVLTSQTDSTMCPGVAIENSSRETRRVHEECQISAARPARSTPQIRLLVKTNSVNGNPAYNLQFAAKVEDGHHVKISVGGLDSKIRAKSTIFHLTKVVERQEGRSKGILENPLKYPGPRPVPRPLPPHDPDDAYASMFKHVWEHFSAYNVRKWEEAMDRYLSVKMSRWGTPEIETETAAAGQNVNSPQRRIKKQKTALL